jgi:hydrogenase/urease accessory protein HupE
VISVKRLPVALCLLVVFLGAPAVPAHEVRPARLDISQESPLIYRVAWKRPAKGDAVLGLSVLFPSDCRDFTEPVTINNAAYRIERRVIECSEHLSGREVKIVGLDATMIDTLATVTLSSGDTQSQMLRSGNASFTVAYTPTAMQVARTYFELGVEHILLGIDHLLFVLGLLLILSGWKKLVSAITAFTVAHSITLALATFNVISAPQGPVEAVIALSIVFLATEYAHQLKGVRGWTSKRPWTVSFIVGLLHGLGFAKALGDVGLPQSEIPLALFTFNLGVEAGQLAFVAAVLLTIFAMLRLMPKIPSRLRTSVSYGIGSVSAFWFIERTFAIF